MTTPQRKLTPVKGKRLDTLNDVMRRYERDAEIAAKHRAYYAACMAIGSALEAALLAMCSVYPEKVATLPPADIPKGRMDRWTLDQLIKIANQLGWLPARKHPNARTIVGD